MLPKSIIKVSLTLMLFIPLNSFSQSLSPERVAKIKNCTVRISIQNSNNTGTGFLVGLNGMVVTCWHVINSSLHWDAKGVLIKEDTIFVKLNDGEIIDYGISTDMLKLDLLNAQRYDFCILFPIKTQSRSFEHLKIGNFDNIKEGEEVYTCGYPFSINQPFISRGILSTKYNDTVTYYNSLGKQLILRQVGLLDLTLNKGNSGGAIVRIGKTIDDDEVIGIADFIINPLLSNGEKIIEFLKKGSGIMKVGEIDPNSALAGLATILNDTSDGISGCVSINYYLDDLSVKKK